MPLVLPDTIDAGIVELRKPVVENAQLYVDAVTESLEHLRPWMPWIAHEPMSLADREELIRTWLSNWEQGSDFHYSMFMGDTLVGATGFHTRQGPGIMEIGYWVHVDYAGRGIATATSRALTSVGCMLDDVHAIEIHHDKANGASGAVPRKLGYSLVREARREPEAPGESGVMCVWQMRCAEWRRLSAV